MKTVLENQIVYSKKFLDEFQEAFVHEHLKSQIIASTVLCIVLTFAGISWLVFSTFFEQFIYAKAGFHFAGKTLGAMLLVFAFYEGILASIMKYISRHKKKFPEFLKFVSSFIEVSIITIILFEMAVQFPDPIMIFESPGIFVYFFFIILSILKLSPLLGAFTGLMCGIGFLTLYFYFVKESAPELKFVLLYSPIVNIIKALMMSISGGISGFVAGQLGQKIRSSLENISRRNYVTSLFGQYISPIVAEKLLSQKAEFPPELKHVCILFLDIRDFTSFSEKRTPKEVIDFLNIFFVPLIDIVNKNQGFINKFLGDGFMAVFGAPIDDERDRVHGVQAAMQIIEKVGLMNENMEIPLTRFGMGLHAGTAMTGNVGSEERKEYTIIGDTVNIASRVESLNKEYHSKLIVSDIVYEAVKKDYTPLSKAAVQIRGKHEPMDVYILA